MKDDTKYIHKMRPIHEKKKVIVPDGIMEQRRNKG